MRGRPAPLLRCDGVRPRLGHGALAQGSALRSPLAPWAARDEEGSALIEFVGLAVALLLPLLYLLLSVFSVQRAAFAVTQAAREAGRAYATSPSLSQARSRATYAAQLALTSQGVDEAVSVGFGAAGSGCAGPRADSAASLRPGARFTVCVRTRAALPLGGAITVNGQYGVSIDSYRSARG